VKCVVCGREVEQGILCGKCMVEKQEVAKIEDFSIEVCSRCGSIRLGTKWLQKDMGEVIEEMVFKKARVVEEFDVDGITITPEC